MFAFRSFLPVAISLSILALTSCMALGPQDHVVNGLPLGPESSTGGVGESQSEATAQRNPRAMSIGFGRAFLSSDLSPGDEISTLGLEVSSSAAFGTFGWEFGIATGSEDHTESSGAGGSVTAQDFDYMEFYAGARKGFSYGPVELHAGFGVSYVDLSVSSSTSLFGGARGIAPGEPSIDDSSLGGYVQLGAFAPLADWH